MNIYQAPEAHLNDDVVNESMPGARRRFLWVVASFVANGMLGATSIYFVARNPDFVKVTVSLWLLATILYSIFAGLYFAKWGKYRLLWSGVILFCQPISLLATFPYILLKAYRHNWHAG